MCIRDRAGHYIKYGKRKAMEIATLGCAVRVKLSEDKTRVEDVRLGYGVAGPTPLRCRKAEEGLKGCAVADQEAVTCLLYTSGAGCGNMK